MARPIEPEKPVNPHIRWLTVGEGVRFRTGPFGTNVCGGGVEVLTVATEDMRVPYDKRLVQRIDGLVHFQTEHGWLTRRPKQRGKTSFL